VTLIDHQGQMLFGTSNFDSQGIINNTVAISKAARVFDVPVVLSTVETKSFSGNLWPQIRAVFPDQEPIERSFMHVPDAGSYAPVTVLVDERADGVHLSYDRMASLLAPYGNRDALEVARDLDRKVEDLLRQAAA
jgi:hypothetical protein